MDVYYPLPKKNLLFSDIKEKYQVLRKRDWLSWTAQRVCKWYINEANTFEKSYKHTTFCLSKTDPSETS